MAVKTVGTEANKLAKSICGRCPICWWNKFSNHKAAIIVIGTKPRNSTTFGDKLNFFKRTNGMIRDSQVTNPHAIKVHKTNLVDGMFQNHPYRATYQSYD